MTKVLLFGIDGASPELLFGPWLEKLPNIRSLTQRGCFGNLHSTIPPITIAAWNSMISGKDPSEIGVFSYTYRDEQGASKIVSSHNVRTKLLWDILGEHGHKSVALHVPLSYPVRPINGCMVSDFLTPSVSSACAYPAALHEKIKKVKNPEIFFDVVAGLAGHKSLDPATLIQRTYEMTDMQVDILKDLLVHEDWSFFMAVMIGTDRMQHMLWHHFDETHRRFVSGSPYKNALLDYYIYLDKKLGEIISLIDDDTVVIVASDHGMVKQEGKININNWLVKEGYLVLKDNVDVTKKQFFNVSFVDMDKSVAYGSGAYHGRVYINKKKSGGRYDEIRDEIAHKLASIKNDKGKTLRTIVYKKEDIYSHHEHPECPDLTIYFDDLRWASNPDLGQEGLYSWESAAGADSAGHSRTGLFLIAGPGIAARGRVGDAQIAQIAPTVLKLLHVPVPGDIHVKSLEVV